MSISTYIRTNFSLTNKFSVHKLMVFIAQFIFMRTFAAACYHCDNEIKRKINKLRRNNLNWS